MTHKYKVGDKVRVTGYGTFQGYGVVKSIEEGGYIVFCLKGVIPRVKYEDNFSLYFYHHEVESINTLTLTLNTTYTAMNGTSWTCIHVRDNGNAVLDNGISSAEYTSEGWRVDGDSRYDVRWEDEVDEVSDNYVSVLINGELYDAKVTLNLINGQPDWSSAKVEGV